MINYNESIVKSTAIKVSSIIFTLFMVMFFVLPVYSKQPEVISDSFPQVNGDYPDPQHPGIRVRVFVHEPAKGNHGRKPTPIPTTSVTPTPTPVLQCADGTSNSEVASAGWKLPSGDWVYNLNPSSIPTSVGENLDILASLAFGEWSKNINSSAKPNFVSGATTNMDRSAYDGLNVIAWGRTQGTALAVTYIRYNTSSHEVVDVDTIFNKKYDWSYTSYSSNQCGDPDSYDALDIMTHELGHWLGLDDEYASNYTENTMYGYGAKGEIKKDTLTSGDISGLNSVY